jgi:mannose-binding lectin 2
LRPKGDGSSSGGKKTASSTTKDNFMKSQGGKSSGSWTWFFLKFVFFGLALTGAYVGYTVYRARQRDRF